TEKWAKVIRAANSKAEEDRCANGPTCRVEEGRGGLGHAATLRCPSPLIKPDGRVSRIRLSDRLHHGAHGQEDGLRADSVQHVSSPSLLDTATADGSGRRWCYQAHRQSPRPPHLGKHTESPGPFLRR